MTLEQQLNLRKRHPNFQTFIDLNESASEHTRAEFRCCLNQKYGEHPLQTMDVFPAEKANAPILVFIHGGYWRALDKRSYSFVAGPYVKQGFTVCVINYRLIPMVTMETLIEDVINAVAWIQQEAKHYNGNPNNIILSGHSAGGHLAIMTYLIGEKFRKSIKAICSISGVFDLAPIRNSYLNEVLQLEVSEVEAFSVSGKDLSVLKCPMLISVGADESELFIQQSEELYQKNKHLAPIEYYECIGMNHYQIIHRLGEEGSPFAQFILRHGIQN